MFRTNGRRNTFKPHRYFPATEQLLSRICPAVSADLTNGKLVITGDGAANTIQLSVVGGEIWIGMDNLKDQNGLDIPLENVTSLRVNSLGGDDTVSVNFAFNPWACFYSNRYRMETNP